MEKESKGRKKNHGQKKNQTKNLLKPAYSFSQAQNVKLVDQIPNTLHRGSLFFS